MTDHEYMTLSLVRIPEKSRIIDQRRCFVRAEITYRKKDGTPFSEEEKTRVSRIIFGQTNNWTFPNNELEAHLYYECDSGD